MIMLPFFLAVKVWMSGFLFTLQPRGKCNDSILPFLPKVWMSWYLFIFLPSVNVMIPFYLSAKVWMPWFLFAFLPRCECHDSILSSAKMCESHDFILSFCQGVNIMILVYLSTNMWMSWFLLSEKVMIPFYLSANVWMSWFHFTFQSQLHFTFQPRCECYGGARCFC